MATHDARIYQVFQAVIAEFKQKLGNDNLYTEIFKTTSIDQVYDLTDKLQEEQQKTGSLRHLSKIGPYLERLRDYSGAIEVFVQVQPDILALIWGPIKLLIQWTSTLKQSFDAIIDITAKIGNLLPEFKEAALIFGHNACLNEVLALFFQDILDFYVVALKFFSLSRWRHFFESMWPSRRDKIAIVMTHIEQHTGLMRNEVRREDIRAEHDARLRALEHFEKMEKTAITQEYNAIETHISPVSYDDVLNRIESRLCDGTGKWLIRNVDFCKWLDKTDATARQIWLQGIPGAGKTFLTAIAIRHATKYGKTIFAYLSYASNSTTSALSIFLSLIFQLTQDDHNLQSMLCRLGRKNLKNDLRVATELLQHLLNCAGIVFIILDGIDEITQVERGRLLRHLIQVTESCGDVRILISSRPEADITASLAPKFAAICVNDRNSGSIQAFVTHRAEEWLPTRGFLPQVEADIKALLAPLASSAKGMFLYAEIFLNTIKHLEKEEILAELSILPEDLDAAYLRVLKRINNMSPPDAAKARNILGWIGCSPTPLTIYEMEQALRITHQDSAARVSSRLNILSLCGPIVEVVDDLVGFVHFTVKEYLFSPRIVGYIDLTEATLSLAQRCIWYLCQIHHDPWIDDYEIEANIISGDYRLHYYASTTWLELVECYFRLNGRNTVSLELISALNSLYGGRTKWEFEQISETELSAVMHRPELEGFSKEYPELYKFLLHAAYLRESCSTSEYHIQQREQWATLDPLVIFDISATLHKQFDQTSCQKDHGKDNCHCSLLQWHYGDRRFKCGFLSCPTRRFGFSTKSKRDSHEKYHSRQWKCADPSCEYSDIGFLSRRMRDEHSESNHREFKPAVYTTTTLDTDELQPLLFDLITCDDVEAVRALIPQAQALDSDTKHDLCKLASFSGSVPMIKLLHESGGLSLGTPQPSIIASIRGHNEAGLRWLASHFDDQLRDTAFMIEAILECNSKIVFEMFRKDLITYSTQTGWVSTSVNVLRATNRIPDSEELLLQLWADLEKRDRDSGFLNKVSLGDALGHVAETTCSINLSRKLIEYGAPVNARRSERYMTPLHRAARRSSAASAELIKFLLYHGADPNMKASRCHRLVKQEKGAREISKWLGLSWDELIEKVRTDREKGIGWPGSEIS
ncbi:hypothetical protein B0I35DRAFT_362187 [Stachybotrys elegans]|uniref:NACHT domain-containing protein n=1 Tax=Stachybotrys elegans TaxID=80388 RepID=A0A8K0WKY5_9HYPO|nr:hypothetical protein B0I35DRAFT_362187 [Stachybotrys elegans]